jgi:hypothetical protein
MCHDYLSQYTLEVHSAGQTATLLLLLLLLLLLSGMCEYLVAHCGWRGYYYYYYYYFFFYYYYYYHQVCASTWWRTFL